MPRPRTPLAKAALTGADKKDPQRFRARSEPKTSKRPLGAPPSFLDDEAKDAWETLKSELPWLTFEDRAVVEMVSIMRAQVSTNAKELTASFWGNYRMALSSLGATPVDRTKVYQPQDDDDDDEFAAFDMRPN